MSDERLVLEVTSTASCHLIEENLRRSNVRHDAQVVDHLQREALQLIGTLSVPPEASDGEVTAVVLDFLADHVAVHAQKLQAGAGAEAIDAVDLEAEPVAGLTMAAREIRSRAKKYLTQKVFGGGPVPGFDADAETLAAVRFVILVAALHDAATAWLRSVEGRTAISELAPRGDFTVACEQVEKALEGRLRRLVRFPTLDVRELSLEIIEAVRQGDLQLEKFSTFVWSPAGQKIVRGVAFRAGLEAAKYDDLANASYLEADAFRLRLGGCFLVFSESSMPAILTQVARDSLKHQWAPRGERQALDGDDDAGNRDELLAEEDSAEESYFVLFGYEGVRDEIKDFLQERLNDRKIRPRIAKAVDHFVTWFAIEGSIGVEDGLQGMKDRDRATYYALEKLEGRPPERNEDGTLSDAVKSRKHALWLQISAVLQTFFDR